MKKLIISLLVAFLAIILLLISIYFFLLTPIDKKDKEEVLFTVNSGEGKKEILNNLKTADLIRSKQAAYIYVFLNSDLTLKAGTFTLSRSMDVKTILNTLDSGKTKEQEGINITFKEGRRFVDYVALLSEELKIDQDEYFDLMEDNTYIDSLINEYWFLTDEIKNEDSYYPLEGYLFPETYNFNTTMSAQDTLKVILDNTQKNLDSIKPLIDNSNFSIHEIMTLASIVELEGKSGSDRAGIAGVFVNRLNANMSLGSDVTTYYAERKSFADDLSSSELSACNAYNTRGTCFTGLPVGPVSNPSLDAIESSVSYDENDYLFFVSDKSGKIYFSTTNAEHEALVAQLKENNEWYVYE